ncbi:MAG: hypothetical protein JWM16_6497 [Verrucomicrobiales bacterium]|nr:hypothetical protein [Verrucomicrobiales bacterium]
MLKAPTRKRVIVSASVLVALTLVAFLIFTLGREPSYDGKTVTEWLDSFSIHTLVKQGDDGGGRVQEIEVLRSQNAIEHDPAFIALTAIGARAISTMIARIREPAELPLEMTRTERWKLWLRWQWSRLSGSRQPTRRGGWPGYQVNRKTAAGFMLLALGTNGQGGFQKFMEAYASAPQFTSAYGGRVSGMPVGVAPSSVTGAACSVLPHRRAEIMETAMSFLNHTNPICRQSAVESLWAFPKEALKRKEVLLKLTQDKDESVQQAALGTLMLFVQEPALHELLSPAEVREAADQVSK